LFIILAVVCTLLVFQQQKVVKKAKEHFYADATDAKYNSVPLTTVNSMYCNTRNIAFANNNHNLLRASQRSITGDINDQPDTCNLVKNESSETALLHENYIYYNLMRVCVPLRILNMSTSTDGKQAIVLTLDTSSFKMQKRLLDMLLLNPLFVEFKMGSVATPAYFISGDITNVSTVKFSKSLDISLQPLTVNGGSDPFFNYTNDASFSTLESLQNSSKMPLPIDSSVTVYYLDPQKYPNSQGFTRNLELSANGVRDEKGRILVLNSEMLSTASKSNEIKENFDFYKLIKTYFEYKIPPIFTLQLTISKDMLTKIKQGQRVTIARMYMGPKEKSNLSTYHGYYGDNCWKDVDNSLTNKINNIFSLVAMPNGSKPIRLYLVTGVGENCQSVASNPNATEDEITSDAHTVFVDIPTIKETFVDVTITISPSERSLLVYWTSADGKAQKNLVISKKRACNSQNNFYKLFVDRSDSTILQNIFFETTSSSTVKSVKLGYENLYNHVY